MDLATGGDTSTAPYIARRFVSSNSGIMMDDDRGDVESMMGSYQEKTKAFPSLRVKATAPWVSFCHRVHSIPDSCCP